MDTKKIDQRIKEGRALLVSCLIIGGLLTAGCAGRSESYYEEKVSGPGTASAQTVTVEKEVRKTESDHHTGILGGAFHLVGEILAFPFEVIAGAFRFIF